MVDAADGRDDEARPDLTAVERLIWNTTRVVNERPALKRASHAFLRTAGAAWVYYCTRHLLHLTNENVLDTLAGGHGHPDRGIVIATNHRSFFDMYVLTSVLLRRCAWVKRMYFPVRSQYFYDRLDGLLVNGLMSGLAMYPPIFRDPRRRALNRHTLTFLGDELRRPGTVVGIHPEGTRSKTDDPYTLLPAQPGIGEVVHRAKPIVIPAFILGLSSDLVRQVRGNFNGTGAPITITFGAPMELDEYLETPGRARIYLTIAQAIRDEITRLGAIDRDARARLTQR